MYYWTETIGAGVCSTRFFGLIVHWPEPDAKTCHDVYSYAKSSHLDHLTYSTKYVEHRTDPSRFPGTQQGVRGTEATPTGLRTMRCVSLDYIARDMALGNALDDCNVSHLSTLTLKCVSSWFSYPFSTSYLVDWVVTSFIRGVIAGH